MNQNADQIQHDRIDPARAEAWFATMGLEGSAEVGSVLPPFAHLAYFWQPVSNEALGLDGHAASGEAAPLSALPLRMWAGGRVLWHASFRAGVAARKVSRPVSVTRKSGRSGQLDFVTMRHEVFQRGALVLTEDQDLVYREESSAPSEGPVETGEADERRALKLDAAQLFRFSALTFNAHRIHYDADYAMAVGYAGVVVHGPFLAALLAMFATEHRGTLSGFSFRATAPLVLGDVAWLCRSGDRYWVEGSRRRVAMVAEAS